MSRRTPPMHQERTDQPGQIYSDYAVALNEKGKLETENALLRFATQEQDDKLLKLKRELSDCLTVLSKANQQLGDTEQQLKLREECQEQERKVYKKEINKYETSEERLRADIAFFKEKLEKKQHKLSKLYEEMEAYKQKCKKYKNKLRVSVELLHNLHGLVQRNSDTGSNIGCQTAPKSQRTVLTHNDDVSYDNKILSELFFKGNPFMESLYG